jgi:hypothetical protein
VRSNTPARTVSEACRRSRECPAGDFGIESRILERRARSHRTRSETSVREDDLPVLLHVHDDPAVLRRSGARSSASKAVYEKSVATSIRASGSLSSFRTVDITNPPCLVPRNPPYIQAGTLDCTWKARLGSNSLREPSNHHRPIRSKPNQKHVAAGPSSVPRDQTGSAPLPWRVRQTKPRASDP